MPRIARTVARGYPHHIIQRGNDREWIFHEHGDKQKYLELLVRYSGKWDSPVQAYCIMDNHVHILTCPGKNKSLRKMMQVVAMCYTQYANRKYGRTGRLWESRYHSCLVDDERYLWAVARYIELNPVRAGLVDRAEDFTYSSAKAHVLGTHDEVLGERLFEDTQRRDYRNMLLEGANDKELEKIRYATRTGWPLGSEGFISKMEKIMGRKLKPYPVGRPRKERNNCENK